jgi:molecular chaperone DnaK
MRDEMTSRAQADAAIADGRRAVAAADRTTLSAVNQRLRRLLPPGVSEERRIGGVQESR